MSEEAVAVEGPRRPRERLDPARGCVRCAHCEPPGQRLGPCMVGCAAPNAPPQWKVDVDHGAQQLCWGRTALKAPPAKERRGPTSRFHRVDPMGSACFSALQHRHPGSVYCTLREGFNPWRTPRALACPTSRGTSPFQPMSASSDPVPACRAITLHHCTTQVAMVHVHAGPCTLVQLVQVRLRVHQSPLPG